MAPAVDVMHPPLAARGIFIVSKAKACAWRKYMAALSRCNAAQINFSDATVRLEQAARRESEARKSLLKVRTEADELYRAWKKISE